MTKRNAHPPALMLQGTSSNAGKSVLTAAFCRIFLQDGFRVAPFKSQNMALNSHVTPDGLELGRAQAVQAAACRLEADVRMNPVLLKPNSDTGSQVVVMGRPVGNMHVREYHAYKPSAFSAACGAYDSLAQDMDVMVLEGAGSPAEVNLKAHDIVNMSMARYAGAHVLLVGDIDRGGVFASLVGTMELLDPWERELVAGYLLNKFRGDVTLLDPALELVEARTSRPFLGVVPWQLNLGLPEEDSVTFKENITGGRGMFAGTGQETALSQQGTCAKAFSPDADTCGAQGAASPAFSHIALQTRDVVDIVLVDLPHISNFTDLDALRQEPDVHVRVVRRAEDIGTPDAIILPGSKNTLGDLRFLREQGMASALLRIASGGGSTVQKKAQCATGECGAAFDMTTCSSGPVIVGICGGFQMLGLSVNDTLGIESGGAARGLALLPVRTEMGAAKILRRTTARHDASGEVVNGYEIHHGVTAVEHAGAVPFFHEACGTPAGWSTPCGTVWGTYLHGVFDADGFRRWFIDSLRCRAGMPPIGRVVAPYGLEPAFDRLADGVRKAVDMERIYAMLGLVPRRGR